MASRLWWGVLCSGLTPQVFAEPPNLDQARTAVQQYHDSGLYEKELTTAIAHASAYVEKRVVANRTTPHPKKLAVVLDIDETSLSNYEYLSRNHFTLNKKAIQHHLSQANDPAIQPMLAFYQKALAQGVHVFFVTGRLNPLCSRTKQNLLKTGYTHWDALYCRSPQDTVASAVPYKAKARHAISQKGYVVIATIGDQYSDLKGGFAEKGFKLPNPFYYLP